MRQPLGVVAGITPFNFPCMVPMWMFPLALACGNTFVLKPSERDPSPSLLLAELLREAGLPDGVFNVVQGDREAVDALLAHPDVKAVSFVGSTPVARHVYEAGARHGKRVQALGGAKNHLVVMPDADPEQAVDALIGAAYGSAGERCMAVSVAVLVGDAADRLLPGLAAARALAEGRRRHGRPASRWGRSSAPRRCAASRATSTPAWPRAPSCWSTAAACASPAARAASSPAARCSTGCTPSMSIWREEIFGPVLSCVRVADLGEALELVNSHEYANGASCYTADGHSGARVRAPRARRHGRHQRADPGADGLARLRRLARAACSATCTPTARRACASTRGRSRSCSAGPQATAKGPSSPCRPRADGAVASDCGGRGRHPPCIPRGSPHVR